MWWFSKKNKEDSEERNPIKEMIINGKNVKFYPCNISSSKLSSYSWHNHEEHNSILLVAITEDSNDFKFVKARIELENL